MKQGEPQTTKEQDEPVQGGQEGPPGAEEGAGAPAAGGQAGPERVDWTAILQEHSLVPDSEAASPVVMPEVDDLRIPRRRGLYVVVALVALFSVAASVAVVVALVRGGDEAEPKPAAQATQQPQATPPPREVTPPPQATTPPPPAAPEEPKTSEPVQPAAADDEPAPEKPPARAEKKRPSKPESAESPKSEEKTASRSGRARTRAGSKSDPPADEESGAKPAALDEKPSAADPDKAGPSKEDVARAVDKLVPRVATCAKEHGVSGMVAVRMQLAPSGSVAWSAVREGGSEFQACVSRVLREVRVPASKSGGTVVHTITLPGP
jgi:outer membrane biosynthesis protein TonB